MLMACPAEDQVIGGPWPQGVVQRGHHVAASGCRSGGEHGDGSANSCRLSVSGGFICWDSIIAI